MIVGNIVALINADVRLLDCDDPKNTPGEKLGDYEEEWNRITSGKGGNVDVSALNEVLEREGVLGEAPVDLYARPPFSTITQLMEKEGLSTTDLGEFIRWKAKADNAKKAREAKLKKKTKKTKPTVKTNWLLERKKKIPSGDL